MCFLWYVSGTVIGSIIGTYAAVILVQYIFWCQKKHRRMMGDIPMPKSWWERVKLDWLCIRGTWICSSLFDNYHHLTGYLIALIASGSPYVISSLLGCWVFLAGYGRSSKTWGGLGLITAITVCAHFSMSQHFFCITNTCVLPWWKY